MAIRVGCLLGSRANAWHSEVFLELPEDLAPTIIGTTDPRYPVHEIGLPFLALRFENEVGSWFRRRLSNLRYRLTHRRAGFEFRLAEASGPLGDFDVLNSWELFTEWTRVALDEKRRRGVPVVITVWDNIAGHFDDDRRRGPIRRRALVEADLFLVVTDLSRQALVEDGVDPMKIVSALPSVDADRFSAYSGAGESGQDTSKPSGTSVLAVARLEREKGLHHLVEAVAIAVDAGVDLNLCIAGSGAEEAALREQVNRLELSSRVRFLGSLSYDSMPDLHRSADIFVLPSVPTEHWHEQWGQSLLEAMASGTPCIASSSGSIAETLGDAGVLVEPGNPAAIAGALAELATDPAEHRRLAERGRARVAASFTHRAQAAVLARLYRGMASARG